MLQFQSFPTGHGCQVRECLSRLESTIEYIDPIRIMTNLSSGRMGIAIAQEAQRMGATVTLVYGHGTSNPASDKIVRVNTGEEMYKAVVSELSSRSTTLL